jgi:quercetin dioxygenase-like cupin family protein
VTRGSRSRDTGGALSIVEHPFPVGALVPPHLHTREDEYSIVTEGQIGFRSGDREVVLGSGGYITKPRGQPDWLPDLIARYHLTPPPGA